MKAGWTPVIICYYMNFSAVSYNRLDLKFKWLFNMSFDYVYHYKLYIFQILHMHSDYNPCHKHAGVSSWYKAGVSKLV